ncbi:MAG: ACT domain-containing protein [Jatrophihabitans sp.]|nr:MAG: ACT domain-containing protein [Jatrophihabitans sp.]
MSYLLRVVLPDRPGALGAVATALGRAGADILSVDVIERSPGSATDDIVVELPPDRLADSIVSAAASVTGVRVETIRPYAGQIDAHRELELLDSLAARPAEPQRVLAQGIARVFRAAWALVLAEPVEGASAVLAAGGAAPELDSLQVPWWPATPTRVIEPDGWAPPEWGDLGTELAVAPLGRGAVLAGRPMLPWLPSELLRLQHLCAVATTVTGR